MTDWTEVLRRRSFLELDATGRAEALLDPGTLTVLCGPFDRVESPWLVPQALVPQADDGVTTARGLLDGRPVVVASIEQGFQGGGVGEVSGAKITQLLRLAATESVPAVLLLETGRAVDPEMTERLALIAAELAVALLAAGYNTDRYRRVQRRQRLTMAAELQWDLLPGRALGDDRFQIAGQLEPAYEVHGDHFDWAVDGDLLTITVLNGSGDGMAASLLTITAVTAMRNARRSGANLVEQAELASDAVFAHYGGKAHLATLLLEIDLVGGRVQAVDAGSPKAMIARDGEVRPVELEQQLPLGMFSEIRYDAQDVRLEPGDRLLVVSDGVHAAAPGGQSPFGESGLLSALRRTRLQPAAEAVGTVMRSLREYHDGEDPQDDAVTVCLDWRR